MTLPTEAFAEVVAFLRLFDMSALMVTNVLYSSLALKASTTIRCEKFPDLNFYIRDRAIRVYRVRQVYVDNLMERRLEHVVSLDFQNEPTLAEFIAAAFPNCIFMGVGIERGTGKHIVDAVMRIADSVIVTEALGHGYKDMSPEDSTSLVGKFRRVNALCLYFTKEVSSDEVKEMANVYRGSGLQELFYYDSPKGNTPKKVAFL